MRRRDMSKYLGSRDGHDGRLVATIFEASNRDRKIKRPQHRLPPRSKALQHFRGVLVG